MLLIQLPNGCAGRATSAAGARYQPALWRRRGRGSRIMEGDEEEAVMTRKEVLKHCLAKPGAWQDEPWEGDVVAKVGDKIFAFLGGGDGVGIKCGSNREEADELVDTYPVDVSKMAYIGRSGWNTVRLGG